MLKQRFVLAVLILLLLFSAALSFFRSAVNTQCEEQALPQKALPQKALAPQSGSSSSQASGHPASEAVTQSTSSTNTPISVIGNEVSTLSVQEQVQQAILSRRCRHAAKTQSELQEKMDKAYELGEPHALIEAMRRRFHQCQGHQVDPDYMAKLLLLAEQDSGALKELWRMGEKNYMREMHYLDLPRDEYIEKRKGFTRAQYRLTEMAAKRCDIAAISWLAGRFQGFDPETERPNYPKAMAYAQAFMDMTQDNQLYNRMQWSYNRMQSQLREQEVPAVQKEVQATAELLARCH